MVFNPNVYKVLSPSVKFIEELGHQVPVVRALLTCCHLSGPYIRLFMVEDIFGS